MKKGFDSLVPTIDQLLSSVTTPLFLLIGFAILPTETFAVTAQFVFLYGCLASICQAMLGEPYLISSKHESKLTESHDYTSASIILASSVSILSFPLSLLITDSLKLSSVLLLPVLAMLLQDSKRIWRISDGRWFLLVSSDTVWFLASVICIFLVNKSDDFFIFFAWGIPGIMALLIIFDYSDFRRIDLKSGWNLLLHFFRKYYFTVVETTASGASMVIAYWAISNYLGASEFSTLRYASLLFGLSTVVINRQRVFDFASENIQQLEVVSNLKTFGRIMEVSRVVAFNLIFLLLVFAVSDEFNFGLEYSSPGSMLLFVLALDRLSVGVLMSVTVFLKTHKDPRTIAKIRTLVSVSSALIYFLFAFVGTNLVLLIVFGFLPYLIAFGLVYPRMSKPSI